MVVGTEKVDVSGKETIEYLNTNLLRKSVVAGAGFEPVTFGL